MSMEAGIDQRNDAHNAGGAQGFPSLGSSLVVRGERAGDFRW